MITNLPAHQRLEIGDPSVACVESQKSEIELQLNCDLSKAANFYMVELDEVEMKSYATPFSITSKNSNESLSLECEGCNERIKIDIIELPRINNLKSSKFLVQIAIVIGLVLLPSINVGINSTGLYALAALISLIFVYEIYTYMVRAPARLDTLFFWHSVGYRKHNDS